MTDWVWLVPLLPLAGYVFLLLSGRRTPEAVAAGVSVVLTGISCVLSLVVFFQLGPEPAGGQTWLFHWLTIGSAHVDVGISLTHLNALMLVVVSLVSVLVLLFSQGYMHGDERFSVFYQYLNLFVFSMLGLVISPNLLQLYIFWEMVGLCSYLLVGFWYFKPEAALAAKKSFIVTRIGDTGLFVGMILLFLGTGGSFDFTAIFQAVSAHTLHLGWMGSQGLTTLAALLVFLGAVGKSAQFPLHVWLPDAMEGPTPVSALIHAATMVAAGVYLVARMFPLFQASPPALTTVAWIGGVTALLAALIALTQRDIKRVIAYSTISQLGYMMLALGIGAYALGVFHLFTHAFFKALLFLAAGSVIHAVDTQDLFQMGGLGRKLPITRWSFLAGALALAGIFPFSGFWSKDDILTAAWQRGDMALYWLGLVAAFCTAFYIFRVYFLVFTGQSRDEERTVGAHEGSWVMTVPLVILAALATLAGFVNTPWTGHGLERYLEHDATASAAAATPVQESLPLMVFSVVVGLLGIGLAYLLYGRKSDAPARLAEKLSIPYAISLHKFYLDEVYYHTVVVGGKLVARLVRALDRYLIDGIIEVGARLVGVLGLALKYTQNGQVQAYGVIAAFGLVVVIVVAVLGVGGVL
ncbi:NADH-quinone oxidoreductase subunit L [Alicyclobacillus shizuokensis]|uniref:NADH-quinone oxidoreductase subunit L n=1 Tax=Alicyclobacillus shizuokensis TaxID=392014 RepID=UPI0008298466|nr:NADH-quinone oxidoreductase subunit L [Alicyclobacillus shizuokensis]